MSATTKETIDRIKDLMRHRNPTGDLENILDASLPLLLARLEKERLGKTPRPRKRKPAEAPNARASSASPHVESTTRAPTTPVPVEATAGDPRIAKRSETTTHAPCAHDLADAGSDDQSVPEPGSTNAEPNAAEPDASTAATKASRPDAAIAATEASRPDAAIAATEVSRPDASTAATKASRPGSRHVPTHVRREVFARDGAQCSYVGPDGDRCPARGYLERDHIHPKGLGGTETAANLRVRCRAHNALYAEQVFGRAHVAARMDLRHRKSAPPIPDSFETAARGLRSMGFRETEMRRALETLAMNRDMRAAPVETILREALLVLT